MDTLPTQSPGNGRKDKRFRLPAWLAAWSGQRRRQLRTEVLTAVDTLLARTVLCDARAADALASIAAMRAIPGLDSATLREEQQDVLMLHRRAHRIAAAARCVAAAAAAPERPTGRALHELAAEAAAYTHRLNATEAAIADRQVLLAHSRDILLRHLGDPLTVLPLTLD